MDEEESVILKNAKKKIKFSKSKSVIKFFQQMTVPSQPCMPTDIGSSNGRKQSSESTCGASQNSVNTTDHAEGQNLEERHIPQCLAAFFTNPEKLGLNETDAILSLQGYFFRVLPNRDYPGESLFRSVGHAITGEEQDHWQIRKVVMKYITNAEGWAMLGSHVVPFYANYVEEMRMKKRRRINNTSLKRAYKHYLMNYGRKVEGSLVELVGASAFYGFSYTCILCEHQTDYSIPGKATFRVIHSFEDTEQDAGVKEPRYFFLRIGVQPEDWKWNLLLPCQRINWGKIKILRGTHLGQLWNVVNFQWQKSSSRKLLKASNFYWENGKCVIGTREGVLLGGYTTLDKDLFSNLCWILYKHFNFYNQLRNSISASPSEKFLQFQPAFLRINSQSSPTSSTVSEHVMKCKQSNGVGTVHHLEQASELCGFEYNVIGINEYGEIYQLTSSHGWRKDGDVKRQKVNLLARTEKGVVMAWCALDEMTPSGGVNIPWEVAHPYQLQPIREPYTKISSWPFGIRYRKLHRFGGQVRTKHAILNE